jgi:hypothetical protein
LRQKQRKSKPSRKKRTSSKLLWILYIALIALVLVYSVFSSAIIALLVLLLIIVIVFTELRYSIREEGLRRSVLDIAAALGVFVAIWIALVLILHTTDPVDVVTSCSMAPVLNRGDVVIVQGISNVSSFIAQHNIPIINMSSAEFSNYSDEIGSEWVTFYPYYNGSRNHINLSAIVNSTQYKVGLYNFTCILVYLNRSELNDFGRCALPSSYQQDEILKYNYGVTNVTFHNSSYKIVYTSNITVNNVSYQQNYSNPLIVYNNTLEHDHTIHRVFAAIDVQGYYYLLTKGDNNVYLDQEGIVAYPVSQNDVIGMEIASVPLLGYPRLIISGGISTPGGCDMTIQY